jgi:glycogen synthase
VASSGGTLETGLMRIAILTNEYPPYVYGGAGVHVEYLTRELACAHGGANDVGVYCFGDQRAEEGNLHVRGIGPATDLPAPADARLAKFFDPMHRNLAMASLVGAADIVHGHTWYSHLAGCLVKQLTGAKLVLTTHSLEPHRPWKVEQLGRGYDASTWIERTAYQNADGVIAVSQSMRRDVASLYGVPDDRIRVIPNGIDTDEYQPTSDPTVLVEHGIDPKRPYILFVGRITRQKGIIHLVRAIRHLDPRLQVVLCAGAPDTPEIGREMEACVAQARRESPVPIHWIARMLPRPEVIRLYSQAAVFVCPSVYEPFGIINLEAMSCGTPVVGSAVGGIPEIVVDGETGRLVRFEPKGPTDFEPANPDAYARDLAQAINRIATDESTRGRMGLAARERAVERFGWASVARATLAFYQDLLDA